MLQLSVVVIAWNAGPYIKDCLDSIFQSTHTLTCEIIVVNNGSTDDTPEILKSYSQRDFFRLITLPVNQGVAGGRNRGIREARGKYIWLLDVDTVINQDAVTGMLHYMKSYPLCGICGCKLVNRQGSVQDSCRKLPSLSYKINNVFSSLLGRNSLFSSWKTKIDRKNESQFYHKQMEGNHPFEVEYLIGACQFIRREVVEQIGELDEKIFYGPEDADYCLRASLKGWKIVYLPFVSFLHDYQQVTNRKLVSKLAWIHTKALFYFYLKHKRF